MYVIPAVENGLFLMVRIGIGLLCLLNIQTVCGDLSSKIHAYITCIL